MKLQKGTYTAADFNINTGVWSVQYFECVKINGIIILNAALLCPGILDANTEYVVTTAPVQDALKPKRATRIMGNACNANFGNTVSINIFFDNSRNLRINSPSGENKYIAFSAVYEALV